MYKVQIQRILGTFSKEQNLGYTVGKIAEIISGKMLPGGDPGFEIRDLLIDSRRLIRPEGTMFVALVTSRNDGHQFIGELYEKGVRVFLVSKNPADFLRSEKRDAKISLIRYLATFIMVDDTLKALQKLAAYHRRQFDIPVIGITGSNGKTIVKEWLCQLLSPDLNIIRSPKSYNSQIGVPLSIWKMEKENQLAIFEAGISQPGEMEKLEEIIEPEYGIITNIGHAHDVYFASAIQKTDEKLRLFKHSKLLVYCSDHELIDRCVKFCDPNRTYTPFSWSRTKPADLFVKEVKTVTNKTTVTTVTKTGEELCFSIPFTDEASIENAIHCFALIVAMDEVGKSEKRKAFAKGEMSTQMKLAIGANKSENFAISLPRYLATLSERFASLAPIAMRLELKDAINRCSIINDSYNNDINSLSIALDFLVQQNQHKKKTVILSDILQSGRDKNELYKEIAALLDSKGIGKLIGIGRDMNKYSDKFGMQKNFFYTTDDFLMHYPVSSFKDEAILLKGARIFEFERISNALQQKAHETVLEINLDAMVHNLNYYRSLLRPGVKVMAMVKAFSYGSGSFEIASVLQFHRADYLAVAYADEGVELRKSGIHLPIMVMSPEEQSLDTLLKYNLEPEIYNLRILSQLEEAVKRNQVSGQEAIRVHIKLDTGMHRLGFQVDELEELIAHIQGSEVARWRDSENEGSEVAMWRGSENEGSEKREARSENVGIRVVSVFSHLAASEDETEDDFTREQIRRFDAMSSRITAILGYPVLRHILNSAGISRFPEAQFDMVRLGIGLYGVGTNEEEQQKMRNVSSLRTIVIQQKKIQKGETIGYNRRGKANKDCIIAVIPIGYADGLDRRLGNGKGRVYIGGKAVPIIGNVCMDLCMADVTGMKTSEGDEVVIFDDSHPVMEIAKSAGTIPYEIMTGISGRVKRVYYHE